MYSGEHDKKLSIKAPEGLYVILVVSNAFFLFFIWHILNITEEETEQPGHTGCRCSVFAFSWVHSSLYEVSD